MIPFTWPSNLMLKSFWNVHFSKSTKNLNNKSTKQKKKEKSVHCLDLSTLIRMTFLHHWIAFPIRIWVENGNGWNNGLTKNTRIHLRKKSNNSNANICIIFRLGMYVFLLCFPFHSLHRITSRNPYSNKT